MRRPDRQQALGLKPSRILHRPPESTMKASTLYQLLAYVIGEKETCDVLRHVKIPAAILARPARGDVDRTSISWALSLVLFRDLLRQAQSARRYVYEKKRAGEQLMLWRGAARAMKLACMEQLPAGEPAVRPRLVPFGYVLADEYPMPSLDMVTSAYHHIGYPAHIAQFTISEILPETFPDAHQNRGASVFSQSRDSVSALLAAQLDKLESAHALPFHDATDVVLKVARRFNWRHDVPSNGGRATTSNSHRAH
jgi:hypothetical protein